LTWIPTKFQIRIAEANKALVTRPREFFDSPGDNVEKSRL